jgi:penicillin amidase
MRRTATNAISMLLRLVSRSSAIVIVLGMVGAASAYGLLAASLPRRSGEAAVAGLTAPLTIELDALAIPRIRAATFADALRAQGYMHAQERFFQMDLVRRSAAGELAELFGARALPLDVAQRPFEFRARAVALLAALPVEQVEWIAAYTDGVNAGLADLGARPPEYWLVGAQPAPWRREDSVLTVFAFYTMLSNNEAYERGQGVMHATLPPEVYEFLTPSTSRFDRPLGLGDGDEVTGGYLPAPLPPASALDLRSLPAPTPAAAPRVDPPLTGAASNQWAVRAARGAAGHALLSNDPHLGLRIPNVFYRSELEWAGGAVRGVGIPGLPGILLGASDALAWGATVSNADQSDWVVVETDPRDADRYLTPEGSEPFATATAEVRVAGHDLPERVPLRSTRWGPVVATDWLGRPLALRATWLEPGGLNFAIVGLPAARSVAEGSAILASWAGPAMNWMLADAAGEIGWLVNGPLPRRESFDGSRPESWADGTRAWRGLRTPPALVGSSGGALFTANNRTLPRAAADELGRMWMRPLRAKRIAELLDAQPRFTERDFLAMQLDTRAEGYAQIRDALLDAIGSDETEPLLVAARSHVAAWNGNADVGEPGFRILHVYYRALLERALSPLLGAAIAADPRFVYRWPLADEALRRLLDERPAHLLTREYADWRAFLRSVLLDALRAIEADATRPGVDATWGDVNTLRVRHPFAAQLGPLARWLELPPAPLPGSTLSLRVAAPDYGALVRIAVAPAAPQDGILEMAGGQSGHFLSPQFRDQQAAWLAGEPAPFLAGPTTTRIALRPER